MCIFSAVIRINATKILKPSWRPLKITASEKTLIPVGRMWRSEGPFAPEPSDMDVTPLGPLQKSYPRCMVWGLGLYWA